MKNTLFIGLVTLLTLSAQAGKKVKFERLPQQSQATVDTAILESLKRETIIECSSESGKFLSIQFVTHYSRDTKGQWELPESSMGTNISRQDSNWVSSDIHWLDADPLKDKIADGTVIQIKGPEMVHFGVLNVTFNPSTPSPQSARYFKATCEGKVLNFSTDADEKLVITPRAILASDKQTGLFKWYYTDKKGQSQFLSAAVGAMTVKDVLTRVPSIK